MKRPQLGRVWRWQVAVRPVPALAWFACWFAVGQLLPPGPARGVQVVVHAVIGVLVAVLVMLIASAQVTRTRRRPARKDPDDA